jgi:PTS system mannose-specific IIC component
VTGVTALAVLLIWGTAVGLDLVTGPQIMIARPLVAGTVAGWLLGDAATGLLVGVLFELFQYDVLPVGASRYPEYGPATVAAVAAAHGVGGPAAVALGALVGLATAVAGGASLGALRRLNTAALRAAAPRLESGDPRVLAGLHAAGVGRDAARAAAVTGLGLGLAWLARATLGDLTAGPAMPLAAAAAGGIALAAAVSGTLRLVGRGGDVRWLAGGVVAGTLLVWFR